MQPADIDVIHNPDESRFEATVQGDLVVAEYIRKGSEVAFTHTYVPPPLRGRGIAGRLVQVALEEVRDWNVVVKPLCWYVRQHIERHPEFHDLLTSPKEPQV